MTLLSLCIIGLISIIIIIYVLIQYVLNEKQIYKLKYTLYVALVMFLSVVLIPVYLIRPRNAFNIRFASLILNPIFSLFGIKYRVENTQVLDKDGPCVIVANHQSSVDFIGLMYLWPEHIRYCTVLAKKELIWVLPFGLSAWLAGLEYVDRKNRERSSETMRQLKQKVKDKSLRVWIFPEGK
jgi:lysophosphatidate acyltransferase